MKFKQITNSQTGFSLIELLVVISITALLASMVLAGLVRARESAQDQVLRQNIVTVSQALDLYYQDNGSYPYFGVSPISSEDAAWSDGLGLALKPYLPTLPGVPNRLSISYFSTDASSTGGIAIRIDVPPGVQRICLNQNSYVMYARLYDEADNKSPSIWTYDLFALAGGDYIVNVVGAC